MLPEHWSPMTRPAGEIYSIAKAAGILIVKNHTGQPMTPESKAEASGKFIKSFDQMRETLKQRMVPPRRSAS